MKINTIRWVSACAGMTMGWVLLVSAEPSLPDVLSQMENKEKTLHSIKLHFDQEILFSQTGQSQQVKADAYFGKGGRLRIQKQQPDQQLTVSDGKKVWVYNPKANQVWEGSSKGWLKAGWMPKGLVPLNGYVAELKNNFDLSVEDSSETAHVTLNAVPKDKRLGYRLQFVISASSWFPTKTIYVSDSARVTTMLSDVTVNPVDIARQFQFPTPKGATVIPLN